MALGAIIKTHFRFHSNKLSLHATSSEEQLQINTLTSVLRSGRRKDQKEKKIKQDTNNSLILSDSKIMEKKNLRHLTSAT